MEIATIYTPSTQVGWHKILASWPPPSHKTISENQIVILVLVYSKHGQFQ